MKRALPILLVLAGAALVRGIAIHRGAPELQVDEPILVEGSGAVMEGMRPRVMLGWPGTPQLFALTGIFAGDLAIRKGGDLLAAGSGSEAGQVIDAHYSEFYRRPARWYLMARILTLVLGLATIWLAWRIGNRHFGGAAAGIFAAVVLAVNGAHLAYSRLALPDVPTTFLVTLSLALLLRYVEEGRPSSLLWSAFVAGLATANKFYAAPFVLFVGLTPLAFGPGRVAGRAGRGAAALLVGGAGLLAGCPYLVTDLPLVLKDLGWRNLYQQGVAGRAGFGHGGPGWWQILVYFGRLDYGILAAVSLVAGLAFAAVKRTRPALVTGGIAVLFLLLLGASRNVHPRWLIPVAPFLAVLAGGAFAALWRRFEGRAGRVALVAGTALLAVLSAAGPVRKAFTLLDPLPVEELRAYVRSHLPDGATVGFEQYRENPLPLCRAAIEESVARLTAILAEPGRERKGVPVYAYPAILNEERFLLQKYRHLLRDATEEGYRPVTYGTPDRYERFLRAVEDGKLDAFLLSGDRDLPGELGAARRALVAALEGAAREETMVGGRYRVFLLERKR